MDRGLLTDLDPLLAHYCPARHYAIISDTTVAELYGVRILDVLGARGSLYTFPAGEQHKTRETWASLTDRMLQSNLGRDAAVIALGGGVTGDLAGFVAATYMRGLPLVQVPTTLLAMIDSSIGGKTAVDTPAGKNLVGAFHQPSAVLTDLDVLTTLPHHQLVAGTAEALKHGAIGDRDYFDDLVTNHDRILAKDVGTLRDLVTASVSIKADVVHEDERDLGRRAILNFGHTFAHAIESATGYAPLHGESVALGMLAEAKLGTRLSVTEPGTAEALEHALETFGLPRRVTGAVSADSLLQVMVRDKKTRAEAVRFALLRQVGEAARNADGSWTFDAPENLIKDVWEQLQ